MQVIVAMPHRHISSITSISLLILFFWVSSVVANERARTPDQKVCPRPG